MGNDKPDNAASENALDRLKQDPEIQSWLNMEPAGQELVNPTDEMPFTQIGPLSMERLVELLGGCPGLSALALVEFCNAHDIDVQLSPHDGASDPVFLQLANGRLTAIRHTPSALDLAIRGNRRYPSNQQ